MSKDTHLSKGRVASISFSFVFTLVSIIELVIFIFFLLGGYFILNRYSRELEFSFLENGKQWAINAAALAQSSVQTQNYEVLTRSYISAIDNAASQGSKVEEVFFLSADGVVKAHNDYSEIANPRVDGVKQISSRYNNRYFHAALLAKEGEVLVQDYEFTSSVPKIAKTVALLLPRDFSLGSDFSTGVYVQGKPVGSVHVIVSRSYAHSFLPMAIHDYSILLLFFMLGGLVLAAFLSVFFSMRVRYLENIWKRIFHNQDDSLYSMLSQVEKKIDKLEYSPNNFFPVNENSGSEKNKPEDKFSREDEILEAILIEE